MTDDDGRTTGHGHPISSPFEPKGSCELELGIPLHTQVLVYKSVVHGHVILVKNNRPCSILLEMCQNVVRRRIKKLHIKDQLNVSNR